MVVTVMGEYGVVLGVGPHVDYMKDQTRYYYVLIDGTVYHYVAAGLLKHKKSWQIYKFVLKYIKFLKTHFRADYSSLGGYRAIFMFFDPKIVTFLAIFEIIFSLTF